MVSSKVVYGARVNCCHIFSVNRYVTRFGEFSPLGKIFEVLGAYYLLFGKILNLLWQILHTFGPNFIDVNGQKLKNKLAIWSHYIDRNFSEILNSLVKF